MAVADRPAGMVTVSKTPEEAIAVPEQPGAVSTTLPPGWTAEGLMAKSPGANLPEATAGAGAVRARAAAPRRAAEAAPIARIVNPPGPEGQLRKGYPQSV
ncbi:hypothetical protein GCM10010274_53590 [Streptomyces lavendofoliae]|uniref:Uncharacterized protein n=1 Tax=Streptomyces lavendofoliae TaxID=67314 RepID=A0A918I3H0_9ACTN|nr:hypothetical protein GCM10010274_53590 [Streptomyces lavendofoliae]